MNSQVENLELKNNYSSTNNYTSKSVFYPKYRNFMFIYNEESYKNILINN